MYVNSLLPKRMAWLSVVGALWGSLAAQGQTRARLDEALKNFGVTERLGELLPADAAFVDQEGRAVRLGELFGKRPVLLSFNYTGCPSLCSLQLAGIARAVKSSKLVPGQAFELVTVSIDPLEEKKQLVRAKQVYVRQGGGTGELSGAWHFLKGDEAAIRAVTEASGFRYEFLPATREFRHQATLLVLTPEGRISSYLHGVSYEPASLAAALERAAGSKVSTPEEQQSLGGFLLSCLRFDATGKAPLAVKAMRIGGTAVLFFLLALLGFSARREFKRRRDEGERT